MTEEHEDISDEEWIIWQQATIEYQDKEIHRLVAESRRLRTALEEYGIHKIYCQDWILDGQCNCGLELALKREV